MEKDERGFLTLVGVVVELEVVNHHNIDAKGTGAALNTGNSLRVTGRVNKEGVALGLVGFPALLEFVGVWRCSPGLLNFPKKERGRYLSAVGKTHQHGLGGGSGLVKEGGVGNVHAGEVSDHGLEVEKRLKPALGDLGLIRSVLGVPSRVLHDVPENHSGGEGAIVSHPNIGAKDLVLLGDSLENAQQL